MKRFNRALSDEQCSYLNIQVKWMEDNLMTVMAACPVTVSQGNNPYLGKCVRELRTSASPIGEHLEDRKELPSQHFLFI
jgi:hypothetical protein